MKQAVLSAYTELVKSGLDKLPLEAKDAPEKSASKITVSINPFHSNDEAKSNVKAVGQIVIDDCIVVSGITVKHGKNKEGVKLSELGEKADVSTKYDMNSVFAAKLMTELEKNGITYSAKVSGKAAISVRNSDKAAYDKISSDLNAALKKGSGEIRAEARTEENRAQKEQGALIETSRSRFLFSPRRSGRENFFNSVKSINFIALNRYKPQHFNERIF